MSTRSEIATAIAKRTMEESDPVRLRSAIASFLLEENRISELDSIMRDVLAYRTLQGHVEVTVVSAYPITKQVREDVLIAVKEEFSGAISYVINEKIDESVVGGLRIEFDGEELDLTVKSKLNTFKRLTSARKDN